MKTLKLDLTYRPVGVIDCLEALVLCIVGKAVAVEEYEEEISSPSTTFKIPSVIVLKRAVRFISHGIKPSRSNILCVILVSINTALKYTVHLNSHLTMLCLALVAAKTHGQTLLHLVKNVIKRKEIEHLKKQK